MIQGDGRWRLDRAGVGLRSHLLWRVVKGVVEYYRGAPCNYAPQGRIIMLSYAGALRKAKELNNAQQ
jgi:hypothetical protein